MSNFTCEEMYQSLPGPIVVAGIDQSLVGLASTGFGCDVRSEITYDVSALVDVGGCPATALTVEKMRTSAFNLKDRSLVDVGLIHLAGVLRDELADHFEMTEFFDRDILQHIAYAGILDMERL